MPRTPRANVFRRNPSSGPGAGRLAPARVVSPDHHLIDPTTGLYHWTPERVRAAWKKATAELHEALATGGVSHVVLMVGIPAAGKTTWLSQNAKPGGVYFDATFKDAYARRPIIAAVLQYGVPVEAVVLLTPLDEALRRNATRTPDRRIPDEVLRRMHVDLTGGGMPTTEEGLSKITVLSPQQASDQMLENPSKAFINISNEVKKQGGWDETVEQGKLFCILAGPYTGTYIFGRPNSAYIPKFITRTKRLGRSRSLWLWRQSQVNERLKDLPDFIAQHMPHLVKQGQRLHDMDESRFEYHQKDDQDRDYMDYPADEHVDPRTIKNLEAELEASKTVQGQIKGMYNPVNLLAQQIYILSQMAGVDYDSVIASLKDQPKRLHAFESLRITGRREERARWARALLTTFSHKEALKALYPRVVGTQSIADMHKHSDPRTIRYTFADFPNWLQVAENMGREAIEANNRVFGFVNVPHAVGPAQRMLLARRGDPASPKEAREMGQNLMFRHADTFMKSRIPAKAFHEILKKYNLSQISRISDTVGMANSLATREVLAETVFGRRALQHIQDNDWREVMRDHDFVSEANATAIERQISVDDPTLTRFHKRAEWFILPPGVKPLTTQEEFTAEGKQMGHCVAHYYSQRKSWCFSFRAPDGERATLELSLYGDVNQFYGPGNDPAKRSTRALLAEFLQQNKKNIQGMKKGTFPPQAVNSPKSDDPPADLEE